ncbi:MAG: hypothetical protein Tp1125DCM00d2C21254131_13 [Prokaryotic dsDNA virus sp.]|nr:MAG: hypothetical protein Tp1125DCM00d2C21254131_13 [Prokaryotic dsDNA virus sp.]|tara:strand:+ start:2302 stop:3102 length:801 start_codon:yes stop_codon:yes gene_type:complete
MANHKNFYETIKEARMRLLHSVVMYDGEPYYVLAIENHKADGIFRIYLDKLGQKGGLTHTRLHGIPYEYYDDEPGTSCIGEAMDKWLERNKDAGIVRKMANSPHFNKYRPFPLGMVNCEKTGQVFYTRRGPTRHTQQGLTSQMFSCRPIELVASARSATKRGSLSGGGVNITSNSAYLCYTNQYPSIKEVMQHLTDPKTKNNAAAFHREFAILRGPLDMMFLAYKEDVVGFMPNGDLSRLVLARGYGHCREVTDELGVFETIEIQK